MKFNKWGVFKNMMKVGFFLTLLFIGMQVGSLYVNYKNDNPQGDVMGFLTHEEKEEYDANFEGPSEKFLQSVKDYNNIIRNVWIALFFFVMYTLFNYKEDPEGHFITTIMEKMKNVKIDN